MMDMNNKQGEENCTICGETVKNEQENMEWLCVHCNDSWEREVESFW